MNSRRSTRDLLNTLATITDRKAGFRSIGDAWAATTTPHGRTMLTVLGGLAEFERELIRARTGEGREGARAAHGPTVQADRPSEEGGAGATREWRDLGHAIDRHTELTGKLSRAHVEFAASFGEALAGVDGARGMIGPHYTSHIMPQDVAFGDRSLPLHPQVLTLVCGLSLCVKRSRLFMILQAFIDDSGNTAKQGVFVLAGYIATADQWNAFATEWEQVCAKAPATSDFKTAVAWHKNGEYWLDYPLQEKEAKRDERLMELAGVIRRNVLHGFSVGMAWPVYNSLARGKLLPKNVDSPYFFLFCRIIQMVADWQKKEDRCERVNFIFDQQSKLGRETRNWHLVFQEAMTECERRMLVGTPIFASDSEMTPLKAADMWAWSFRRVVTDPTQRNIIHPRHPMIASLFEIPNEYEVLTRKYLVGIIEKLQPLF